jgi:hypothetical protein
LTQFLTWCFPIFSWNKCKKITNYNKKNPHSFKWGFQDYSSIWSDFPLLIHLSIEPIQKEPRTKHKKALKINSFITRSLPKDPVTMSAIANPFIIMNAKKPTTLFSLIVLLSLNNWDKNFFIVFGNLYTNKYHSKFICISLFKNWLVSKSCFICIIQSLNLW